MEAPPRFRRRTWHLPDDQAGLQGPGGQEGAETLNERNYSAGAADGIFGGQTKTAVKSYQSDRSQDTAFALNADGIVGPKTWARLDPPTIENGAEGDAVELLQELLDHFEGISVAIDGEFGPGTEQAVKDFQTFWGTLTVDGVAGRETWIALFS